MDMCLNFVFVQPRASNVYKENTRSSSKCIQMYTNAKKKKWICTQFQIHVQDMSKKRFSKIQPSKCVLMAQTSCLRHFDPSLGTLFHIFDIFHHDGRQTVCMCASFLSGACADSSSRLRRQRWNRYLQAPPGDPNQTWIFMGFLIDKHCRGKVDTFRFSASCRSVMHISELSIFNIHKQQKI